MSSRRVRRTIGGCLHFLRLFWQWRHTLTIWHQAGGICTNVIFVAAAIILWVYPSKVNLELEFHICAGSHCQYEPFVRVGKFLPLARWMCCCSQSTFTLPSIYQVEMWLNLFGFVFFATIYLQRILNRAGGIIVIYAKSDTEITVQVIPLWKSWDILATSKMKIPCKLILYI